MTRHEKVTPHHFDHIGLYYISLAIRYPQHKAELLHVSRMYHWLTWGVDVSYT